MFVARTQISGVSAAFRLTEVIYHSAVRSVRKGHRNALFAILTNMLQTIILVAVFFFMFSILGLRGAVVRGDFMIYIMSGIFLFMTHTKSMGAIVASEGPASPMMQHAPMNTFVAICSSALGALYIQVLSVLAVLFVYYVAVRSFEIADPIGALGMLFLAWFSGVAVGMVFLAAKPWFPQFVAIASTVYSRANMIASGKMFLANTLPYYMVKMFDWNPLFHTIDQARGFAFINYNPHYSNIAYPLFLSIALVMLGFIGEGYTRKHASLSWGAGR